ncbi:MAG: hypothetical protein IE926_05735 [Micrococcales bacterium]|nr:hypothetical protein [Micrococcales bacterium]
MSTPRQLVADVLNAKLPNGTRVEPYAHDLDTITRDTVMLRIDEVTPHRELPRSHRNYRYTVIVLVPVNRKGSADDRLDALLEDVLHALDSTDLPSWSKVERGVWLNTTTPAYEVALDVPFSKE